jgi:long-chain acyl-CoA synthetase
VHFARSAEFLAASVVRFRDRIAFISMGKAISYGELDEKSRAFGAYLKGVVRLPRGARVALMLPNLLQYPIAMFGALRAGCVEFRDALPKTNIGKILRRDLREEQPAKG